MRQPEPRAQAVFFCDFPTLMIFAGFSKNCAVSARAAGTEEKNDFQTPARQSARQSGKFSRLPRKKIGVKSQTSRTSPSYAGRTGISFRFMKSALIFSRYAAISLWLASWLMWVSHTFCGRSRSAVCTA